MTVTVLQMLIALVHHVKDAIHQVAQVVKVTHSKAASSSQVLQTSVKTA
jgi:hypothetical protein